MKEFKVGQKVFPYVETRDKMIDEILNNVKTAYPKDKEMLGIAIDLTVSLKVAEPSPTFVSDLMGFMYYCSMKKEKASTVLVTIMHDLGEFARNRNEVWFCPRTTGYNKYMTGAGNC
jgi:hypothetical protein